MTNTLSNPIHNPWLILTVTATGTFMATLDAGIVSVALPTITASFQADLPLAQWVVSAYLLVISSLLPIFGRAGDMYGHRLVYTSGFVVFTVSSIACGLSHSIGSLIAMRVLQAIGASMLMANAPGIVARAFPPSLRGRALGINGTVVALGSMTGPGLGGLLVGTLGWQSIFFVNIPVGIAGIMLARIFLPSGEKKHDETFDFKGAACFSLGICILLLVLSHGVDWGWTSFYVKAGFTVSILSFFLFFHIEKRTEHPMIDLSLFRIRPFLAGNLSGLLSFMAVFCNSIMLPFYLSTVLQLSPTQIGLLITPFPLIMAVTAPFSGYLSDKISPVILTTGGLAITTAGLLVLSTLGTTTSLWQIAIMQGVLGLGNGFFQAPNNNSVMSSVPQSKTGIAGSINALMRNLGMVTGTAAAVSVFENHRRYLLADIAQPDHVQTIAAFLSGYHSALLVGAAFAAIGAFISLNRKAHFAPNK
ncbi:MAG: drug resistance transporter, EmrB/QacA subfamily [Firmicutes bacterium]|nr:drug resistance transporter, EmrB/QacA subfamily [Bacillota bacterium]